MTLLIDSQAAERRLRLCACVSVTVLLMFGLASANAFAQEEPVSRDGPVAAKGADLEAMARAQRDAYTPFRRIVEAAKIQRKPSEAAKPVRAAAAEGPRRSSTVPPVAAQPADTDAAPDVLLPLSEAPGLASVEPSVVLPPGYEARDDSLLKTALAAVPAVVTPPPAGRDDASLRSVTVSVAPLPLATDALNSFAPPTTTQVAALTRPQYASPSAAGQSVRPNEAAATRAPAEVRASPAYKVKAGFLYNFAAQTQWPSHVGSELGLCVFGSDPFGADIASLQGKPVGGRTLAVHRQVGFDDLDRCHIVFVPTGTTANLAQVRSRIRDRSVLLVAEQRDALQLGAALNLNIQDDRVTFDANPAAARSADLVLSTRLLGSANQVLQ